MVKKKGGIDGAQQVSFMMKGKGKWRRQIARLHVVRYAERHGNKAVAREYGGKTPWEIINEDRADISADVLLFSVV